MKYTIDSEAPNRDDEILNYIYDYMASLTDRDRPYNSNRQDTPVEIDKSKIHIMIDPPKFEKEVSADDLWSVMFQNPIFVKFEGSDEVVPFVKRGYDIYSGQDLLNTYAEEDRQELLEDPDKVPVQDPGKIDEPSVWAKFLKNFFNYETRSMKEYNEKRLQRDAYERQQVREESANLSRRVIEEDLPESIQDRAEERKQKAKPQQKKDKEKSSMLSEALLDAEAEIKEAERQAKLEEELDENLKLGDTTSGPQARRDEIIKNKKIIVDSIAKGLVAKNPGANLEEVTKAVDGGTVLKDMLKGPNLVQIYADMTKTQKGTEQLLALYEKKLALHGERIKAAEERHPERKARLDERNARRSRSNSVNIKRNDQGMSLK